MKRVIKYLLVATILWAWCAPLPLYGQAQEKEKQEQDNFVFHFPLGSEVLVGDYKNNAKQLEQLLALLSPNPNVRVDSIFFYGTSSPEGLEIPNIKSAAARAAQLRGYLCYRRPTVNRIPYRIYSSVRSWYHIYQDVQADPKFPNKTEVLVLLEYASGTEVLKVIKSMYPMAYEYLLRKMFPTYRNASACVVYFSKILEAPAAQYDAAPVGETDPVRLLIDKIKIDPDTLRVVAPAPIKTIYNSSAGVIYASPKPIRKPLFALKTNLLFDVASLVNIGLEIPIGERFSVGAEVVFPWWLNEEKQNSLQVLNVNLEAKYWFNSSLGNSRGLFSCMTGWFMGVHVGAGYYDLEYQGKGYQGESFLLAGLMGGFAHSIGRGLRMEYSLGVGYMETNYRKYEARMMSNDRWELVKREAGVFSWLGPTQAKVSLVWLLNRNYMKRGGAR